MFLRLPCISVALGAESRSSGMWAARTNLPSTTSCATWEALFQNHRLKKSGSQSHRTRRLPIEHPILLFVSKRNTYSTISHRGSGVVGYTIWPHHNTKDKLGSHSIMTLNRHFGKSLPALSTLTSENRVYWQLQLWIIEDRSGVQDSEALLERHLLPGGDSRPLGTEKTLTDRKLPRPSPLLP